MTMKFQIFIIILVIGTASAITAEEYGEFMRVAARAGDDSYVRAVLSTGSAPVDSADPNGWASLHWASFYGRPNVVKVLLEYNADVNLRTNTGYTPLIAAAIEGFAEVGRLLIEANATMDPQEQEGDNSALTIASRQGHFDFVELLLNNSADITLRTSQGQTALMLAAMGDHLDIQKFLVNKGADVNVQDVSGFTSLILASLRGYTETVRYLLSVKASVHIVTVTGDNALMWAAFYNFLEIAQLVIDAGIDINQGDRRGATPLMGATAQGHVEMVKLLLSRNASVTLQNVNGVTALSISASLGNEELSELLSESSQAAIDQQDIYGRTPLILAAANNWTYVVFSLAYRCPNISIVDLEGRKALDYAELADNEAVIELLEIMANPKCYRFDTEYSFGNHIYQNCERLDCHCTGVWKSSGIKDKNCGKGKLYILMKQISGGIIQG